MPENFAHIVRAAAVAGWWTVLIGAGWLTLVWLIWMRILRTRPAWLISLWGGNLEWKEVQRLMITFLAVAKLILLVCVLLCIWLSLWAGRLD